ncbi:MAG: hypothetical protein RL296_1608, partial [Actinomycetota bacterium]
PALDTITDSQTERKLFPKGRLRAMA